MSREVPELTGGFSLLSHRTPVVTRGPAKNPHHPKINIAPENGNLGKEIPIGKHHFWGLC